MSHSQMLGKVESGGGPIFKVVKSVKKGVLNLFLSTGCPKRNFKIEFFEVRQLWALSGQYGHFWMLWTLFDIFGQSGHF